jgi:hypothetical protein
MAETDELLPPIEIPWKLAATTQPLSAAEPAESTLSLFFFEPDDATLTGGFPDDKVIFVKITASVSPAAFPKELSRVAASFLGEGIPCYHLLLDLKVRNAANENGTIRPYFHAAAPLTRSMVQTGVVGIEAYEGEADGLAIGKSGSQMSETLRSHSSTSSASASASLTSFLPIPVIPSLLSVGGSARSTSTDVTSDRTVSQAVDSTSRDASEERRELISHTTRVENIISLLNAKYVGTPYLRFSLSPQPLQQLSIDPADPNLWFQQLLGRRSSGIEGIQEFTAILLVPKGTDFCINARLRRVCLLDSPPGPLSFEERYTEQGSQPFRILEYLNRVFPPGTPLEELDIDILGGLSASNFRRPVVETWTFRFDLVQVVAAPGNDQNEGDPVRVKVDYKNVLEVWLDTLRYEYERETSKSPLERGVLFGENRFLDTCFAQSPEGGATTVTSSTSTISPLFRLPFNPLVDVGGVKTTSGSVNTSTRARALETVTRWNAIERQLSTLLSNNSQVKDKPLATNDPAVLGVLIDTWRKLPADDPRNFSFDKAAAMLRLSNEQRKQFKAAGATNLAGIGAILHTTPVAERYNADVKRLRTVFRERKIKDKPPDPIPFPITSRDVAAITDAIGTRLASNKADLPE